MYIRTKRNEKIVISDVLARVLVRKRMKSRQSTFFMFLGDEHDVSTLLKESDEKKKCYPELDDDDATATVRFPYRQ